MLFAGAARAQNTVTGAFQGDVSSRTGEIITAAAVEITNEQTGVTYNLTTDSKGRFYQGLLAPGFYTIRVTGSGYRPQFLRREIKISLTGDVVPVPVRLEPETAATAGTAPPVTAEEADDIRVEINTTDARRDGSSREEELEKLPLGATTVTRSFDELALLLPGVAPPPQTIGDVAGPGVGPGVGSA
ncbi:MAG: carboxypeptidase-like regulatory domain-containing protein [Pyrinomonadaceae bacterium]|nr:carboxypeptidase-like regulatory domain-containing protein [Pyrinomonadaceae bacterium]